MRVEVIEDSVRWESAEQLVDLCTSWWDWAERLEKVEAGRRRSFVDDAVATLRKQHPGPFQTWNRSHVLFAVAP